MATAANMRLPANLTWCNSEILKTLRSGTCLPKYALFFLRSSDLPSVWARATLYFCCRLCTPTSARPRPSARLRAQRPSAAGDCLQTCGLRYLSSSFSAAAGTALRLRRVEGEAVLEPCLLLLLLFLFFFLSFLSLSSFLDFFLSLVLLPFFLFFLSFFFLSSELEELSAEDESLPLLSAPPPSDAGSAGELASLPDRACPLLFGC